MDVTVHQVVKVLDAVIICGEEYANRSVKMGCGCDLMSHVLAHIAHDHTMLLTGLSTPQVIYTSDAVDIKVICFVRGKCPDEETVQLAIGRHMVLLRTGLPLFESCGRLYKYGLIGCSEYEE